MADGDAKKGSGDYAGAIAAYEVASGLKANESAPKDKIKEVQGLMAEAEANQKAFEKALADAQKAFDSEDLDEAKSLYGQAKTLDPSSPVPDQQLAAIDAKLGALAAAAAAAEQAEKDAAAKLDADYNAALADGDAKKGSGDYAGAIAAYEVASGLKANESAPKDKIKEVQGLMAEAEANQKAFEKALADAQKAFDSEDWDEAKSLYSQAKTLDPSSPVPDQQLAAIDAKLGALAAAAAAAEQAEKDAAAQLDADYNAALADGDAKKTSGDYAGAIADYEVASGLKADESAPKDKIKEVQGLMAEAEANKKAFEKALADAQKAFDSEKWQEAKGHYESVLSLDASNTTAKAQIVAIDQKLKQERLANAEAQRLADAEAQYKGFIEQGDDAFKSSNYTAAKTAYASALNAKPNKAYPQEKIAEIDLKLKAQATAEQEKQAAAALAAQQEADEQARLAKLQADEEAKLAAAMAAKEAELEAYNSSIADADAAFGKGSMDQAKTLYNKALTQRPGDVYAAAQIAKIDEQKLASFGAEKAYDDAVKQGLAKYNSGNYSSAKSFYKKANAIRPSESEPKQKLADIEEKLKAIQAEQAALISDLEGQQKIFEQEYQAIVREAESARSSKDYNLAISRYEKARSMKPSDTKVEDALNETVEEQRAERAALYTKQSEEESLAQKESAYKKYISEGDQFLAQGNFEGARNKYQLAARIFPQRSELGNKLVQVNDAEYAHQQEEAMMRKARHEAIESEKKYNALIIAADNAFKSFDLETAKTKYLVALDVNPGVSYPNQQLQKIETLEQKAAEEERLRAEAEQKANDKKSRYAQLVKDGDQQFRSKEYVVAKASYKEANKIFPYEAYPVRQINKIEIIEMNQNKPEPKPVQVMETFRERIARTNPAGVNKTEIEEVGRVVTIVTVVKGDLGDQYIKESYAAGGTYYSKNGKTYPKQLWMQETGSK